MNGSPMARKIMQDCLHQEGQDGKRFITQYGQKNKNPPKKNSFAGFVPAAFRDHVPLLYTVHLWNNIVENQN